MNNEELLQETLEKLEEGLSLEECLASLPPDEAELLKLTLSLRSVQFPAQDSESAAVQRANLVSQAASHNVAASDRPRGQTRRPWASIQRWIRERASLDWVMAGGLAPAALILLIGAITLLVGSPNAPAVVEREQGGSAIAELSSSSVGEADNPEASSISPEGGAVAESAGGTAIYVPVMSIPLLRDAQTATIDDIKGVVEIQASDGEWTAVREAAHLKAGQRLRTAALSSAKLLFYDGSQATVKANSEISIDELDALRPETGFRTVVLTQWLGESKHEVAFRNDRGSRYEVKTPTGSGIARGTIFNVLVTADLVSQYSVEEGAVSVSNADSSVLVLARQATVFGEEEAPAAPSFIVTGEGEVTAIGETWTIAGRQFATTEETVIVGEPQVGDIVFVRGRVLEDGSLAADLITLLETTLLNHFTIIGEVEEMGDEAWTVAGQTIGISVTTDIDTDIELGDIVKVTGVIQEDVSLLAHRIQLIEADAAGHPFEFTGIVQDIGDEMWLISGVDIAVDEDTEIEEGIEAGDLVKVEGHILEDGTWLAAEIKLVEEDEAKFEFTGIIDSIDPWQVAGIPFETDEDTEIEEDLEVGDLVHVEGRILPDGTWLADEIKLIDEDELLTIVIIGTLDSIDPWSVSGYPFEVDENTEIEPDLEEGDLVRVEALILEDGTWLALEITLFEDELESGCLTVTAVVLSAVDGEVTIEGWPIIVIGDDTDVDGEIEPGSIIIITMCIDEDGMLVVVSIIVISSPILPPDDDDGGDGQVKVTLCHNVERNPHTITVGQPAAPAHLGHGDYLGACNGS